MSFTDYAKRTEYKPIDFFFRGVVDVKSKKVVFVDAFQILNDRFLGRMNVCNYFFVAENSSRINELNIVALDELKNYNLVMKENFCIPQKLVYSLPLTTRFLENDKSFQVLLETLKENAYKRGSLVINFNGSTLMHLDEESKKNYMRLRKSGLKICVSGFGEEYNSLDLLARFNFDFLRVEASYFTAEQSKKRLLQFLVKYCSASKIGLIVEGVDSPAQMARFKRAGVKLVTGKAASKLSRWVTNGFLGLAELNEEQKKTYREHLKKELDAERAKAVDEIADIKREIEEKIDVERRSGKIIPSTPRPELFKSPYQVRLDKQKQAARAAAEKLAGGSAAQEFKTKAADAILDAEKIRKESQEKRLVEEMADARRFEGGIQNMLALSFASDKSRLPEIDALETKNQSSARKQDKKTKAQRGGKDEKPQLGAAESEQLSEDEVVGAAKNQADGTNLKEKAGDAVLLDNFSLIGEVSDNPGAKQKIEAAREKELKLYSEFKSSKLFEQVGLDSGCGGFGIKLHVSNQPDSVPIVGHYNEQDKWVDDDGREYNGYFDENGGWNEYEEFDSEQEGHYNENAQWVDKDGTVYDGYFDEQGRWIDYSYTTESGEVVDNGYFDETIGKWVPFGYFDANGNYINL
jgi:EAL domain-containing protein (putative c-di-GMP-specific phosphodiesterase class I)